MKQFLLVEKYRPQTVQDCILPHDIKQTFQQIVDSGELTNMILSGSPGTGKTTVAIAMAKELDYEYFLINGSEQGNIDTLRTDIKQFASTVSLNGNKKVVILDEADYLNSQSTQPALRGFIEEFADNCRFILTCNFPAKILDALHSRCTNVEFKIPTDERPVLAKQFFKRVQYILEEENISYDKQAVVELIKKHYPDFRKIINEIQRYGVSGQIDAGILVSIDEKSYSTLIESLKDKDIGTMRKWIVENLDQDVATIVRYLYDHATEHVTPNSVPEMILILNEYLYKHAFVADPEVNLAAMMTELMINMEWK